MPIDSRNAARIRVRVRPSAKSVAQRLMIYRALATMVEAGVQIHSCFEFLSHQAETQEMRDACTRTADELASGHNLSRVAMSEPVLFSPTTARMLGVGAQTGRLVRVLARLADDERANWEMKQRIQSQLFYPVVLAVLALAAGLILPPLALSGLLTQVMSVTDDPPAITRMLVAFSSVVSSGWFMGTTALLAALAWYKLSQPATRDRLLDLEHYLWKVPWVGSLPKAAFSSRFLQIFALSYDVGLPATDCLKLAAEASGSRVIAGKSANMISALVQGEGLTEAIAAGDFLPRMVMESIQAGEQVAKVSVMMRFSSSMMLAELDYRIENVLRLVEPLLLSILGFFVGVFALGCLLPILKLTESL